MVAKETMTNFIGEGKETIYFRLGIVDAIPPYSPVIQKINVFQ